jgi:DNA-binding PadR family transcriptional regulator
MLENGWLHDGWENPVEIVEKRPARRYYELTGEGATALAAILDDARSDSRFETLVGRFA